MVYGLVAPGYDMAKVLAARIAGDAEARFEGADMSTKLKLMGVEVANIGDSFADAQGAEARKISIWSGYPDAGEDNDLDRPVEVQYGPVVNDPRCGLPVIARRRVVGGSEAGFGRFPWQALIRIGMSRCGGK